MNKATVYLWFGGDLKDNFLNNLVSVGHVSLQYSSNSTDYISFWPAGKKNKMRSWSVPSRFVRNYHEDCEEEIGREADMEIELNCLNKVIVEGFLHQFNSNLNKNKEFHIYHQNCSTIISKALIIGSGLEKKIKGKGGWLEELFFNKWFLSILTFQMHETDQYLRFLKLRSSQETSIKFYENSLKFIPDFLSTNQITSELNAYVKNHGSIVWSPYHVARFALNLKKELGN